MLGSMTKGIAMTTTMTMASTTTATLPSPVGRQARESAFGYPRSLLRHRFVHIVVSPRAYGLSLGFTKNSDRFGGFTSMKNHTT